MVLGTPAPRLCPGRLGPGRLGPGPERVHTHAQMQAGLPARQHTAHVHLYMRVCA